MKWLKLLILTALAVLVLVPSTALASTSQDVTVTATGYVCEAPGGFTVTYISDYEIGLSWTLGVDAVNTMVRAAVDRMPESRTDGYLVYEGSETSASDWSKNLDTIDAMIYYRAWSQNAEGIWEEGGASGFIEGVGMTLIAFAIIITGLLIAGFVFKKPLLFLAAGFASSGLGFILFGEPEGSTKWMFGWAAAAISLICYVQFLMQIIATRRAQQGRMSRYELEQEDYKQKVLRTTRRR